MIQVRPIYVEDGQVKWPETGEDVVDAIAVYAGEPGNWQLQHEYKKLTDGCGELVRIKVAWELLGVFFYDIPLYEVAKTLEDIESGFQTGIKNMWWVLPEVELLLVSENALTVSGYHIYSLL